MPKKDSEKKALGRVLYVLREVYAGGGRINTVVLDKMSAALSHCGGEVPLSGLMGILKREIKRSDGELYARVRVYFSRLYPVLDYDFDRAREYVPALICGGDRVCESLIEQPERVPDMTNAMRALVGYILGEFGDISFDRFYELVFGYYRKVYGEAFIDEEIFRQGRS